MKHSTVCFTEIQWLFIYWIVEVQFLKVINYFRYKIWMLWKWWNMRFKFFSVSDAGWRQCSSLPQDCWLRNSECLEFEKCWKRKIKKLNKNRQTAWLLMQSGYSTSVSTHILPAAISVQGLWKGGLVEESKKSFHIICFAGNLHTLWGAWICPLNFFSDWRLQSSISCEWTLSSLWKLWEWIPAFQVWNVCIALQSTPRLLFARMYYRYFKVADGLTLDLTRFCLRIGFPWALRPLGLCR